MVLTNPPNIFLTFATNGMLVLAKFDPTYNKLWIERLGADYITDYNIGAKISACPLRDSVKNSWIELRPLPFQVVLNQDYALAIYLIKNGIKIDKDIQQFPLQTEKFILFTLPLELQRVLSNRSAIKADEHFTQMLNDVEEDDYYVKEPTIADKT